MPERYYSPVERVLNNLDYPSFDRIPVLEKGVVHWRPAPTGWHGLRLTCDRQSSRIDEFLRVPAKLRFLILKPCLAYFHLAKILGLKRIYSEWKNGVETKPDRWERIKGARPKVDWVILGFDDFYGASGQAPMSPDVPRWHQIMVKSAGIPFFFEGWGEWVPGSRVPQAYFENHKACWAFSNGSSCGGNAKQMQGYAGGIVRRPKPHENTRLLDGREWNQLPTAEGAVE